VKCIFTKKTTKKRRLFVFHDECVRGSLRRFRSVLLSPLFKCSRARVPDFGSSLKMWEICFGRQPLSIHPPLNGFLPISAKRAPIKATILHRCSSARCQKGNVCVVSDWKMFSGFSVWLNYSKRASTIVFNGSVASPIVFSRQNQSRNPSQKCNSVLLGIKINWDFCQWPQSALQTGLSTYCGSAVSQLVRDWEIEDFQ
jgi:hypothetical protein